MGVLTRDRGRIRPNRFYEFALSRPDGEKWELIEGESILSPAPNLVHQIIVRNLIYMLSLMEDKLNAGWNVIPGIGIELSERSVSIPECPGVAERPLLLAGAAMTPSSPLKCSHRRP